MNNISHFIFTWFKNLIFLCVAFAFTMLFIEFVKWAGSMALISATVIAVIAAVTFITVVEVSDP